MDAPNTPNPNEISIEKTPTTISSSDSSPNEFQTPKSKTPNPLNNAPTPSTLQSSVAISQAGPSSFMLSPSQIARELAEPAEKSKVAKVIREKKQARDQAPAQPVLITKPTVQ